IRFHQHGGPEVLRYEDAPTPEPGPGEVLVALRAAALNHLDIFTRNGDVPKVPLPHIGGADGAGAVAANGPSATRYPVGPRVFVTAGSQEKLDRAKAIGADVLINHKATDFSKEVWGLTQKRGVDVVIENVGAATWAGSIRALAKGGRLVTCGATSGPKPDEDIRRIFVKQITIYGSTMGTPHDWEQLNRLLAAKALPPLVDPTAPPDHAAQAQELLEHGAHFGKNVLAITPLS